MKLTHEGLSASVWYDDRDPGNPGWYAEYFDHNGTIDDSQKIDHDDMPVRRNASKKAERLAMKHLRALAKDRRAKARERASR